LISTKKEHVCAVVVQPENASVGIASVSPNIEKKSKSIEENNSSKTQRKRYKKRKMAILPLKDELMVQQQLPAHPNEMQARIWQHMVAVIMLNQTGRKAVKYVLPLFLNRWYDAASFLWATEDDVKEIIWPLGMVNVRFQRLKRMTADFMLWDGHDATELYGIGKYGSDSYEIFFKQNYTVEPTDKELKRYLNEEIFNLQEI
jgi:hypothetical protein